jgi:hypothetical protein
VAEFLPSRLSPFSGARQSAAPNPKSKNSKAYAMAARHATWAPAAMAAGDAENLP